jgi:hypothetical protein
MRTSLALALLAAGVAVSAQTPSTDPEGLLSGRFQFNATEIGQVRQGQPAVKLKVEGTELGLIGAIRLPGKKERLSEWVKNIEHFRTSAELGEAHIITVPISANAFAGVPHDPPDLGRTLADRASAYVSKGNPDAVRTLIGKAATLTELAPGLVSYLQNYPASRPEGIDEVLYWSSTPADSNTVVSLHHLVFYRGRPGEIWIADKNIYASRYFDAGVMVIGLYDAPDGNGFYAVAGSRVKSSQIGGVTGAVLRRQIQRSASDTVKTYLEWIRDSLAMGS